VVCVKNNYLPHHPPHNNEKTWKAFNFFMLAMP
jgi:hypothetical protein